MALNVGDLIRLSGAFTNPNDSDAPIDPTAVFVSRKEPGGTVTIKQHVTDPEVIKDSTGNYHIDIDITAEGLWHYRWYSTGTAQAAEESTFVIVPAKVV